MNAEIKPIINEKIQRLCVTPYYNHPRGCPNYNHKYGCPPNAPLLSEVVFMDRPIWFVWTEFNLADHRAIMRHKHPYWSRRQLDCLLYWQPKARKHLRWVVSKFIKKHYGLSANYCPEAMGVNVTETIKQAGVILEWPPENIVRMVALIATQKQGQQNLF